MPDRLLNRLCPELAREAIVVHLFGGPYVTAAGRTIEVPEGSKRLLALAALNGGRLDRRCAAEQLWPDADDLRAAGNLRSALWRLRGAGLDVLDSDRSTLGLQRDTVVDLSVIHGWAARIVEGTAADSELLSVDCRNELTELLPGWHDDWVIFERERIRQRLLHAMEALALHLVDDGRCAQAIDVALTALYADPLRESAMRVLLAAHLAEGNYVEALRAYADFRRTLREELGVGPSEKLDALMRDAAARLPGTVDRSA